ncbi:unnamed protein product [Leptidea sinapis]|uniref:N-acetyltransferase domain-containing protein n=1 Tax=Leptidea sinapis TaxID=189913 RepID=A0A5E4Q523_9NEOP|nr:unnamed protein product [Leptidea sinapis]
MTTFKVERIVEADTENVMKLLRRTFFIDEPLNKAIGLCEPDGCPELEDYCLKTLPGLSHKALDEDGNIVGVLINGVTPVAEDHELKILLENCKNPKFKKVLQILVLRDKEARIWEKYPQEKDMLEVKIAATAPEARNRGPGGDCPELEHMCRNALPGLSFKAVDAQGNIVGVLINGITPKQFLEYRENNAAIWKQFPNDSQFFEIKVAATDPNWRNKGIMNVLVASAEELAKKEGVRLVRLDASSDYSAKAALKLGFKIIYTKPFNEIIVDGKPLIVPDPPHIVDRVFVKELF